MSTPPTPYARQASFTGFSTEQFPTTGQDLEAEFNKISQSIGATQGRLAEIQRDDGQLANLSVHPDALNKDVRALLAVGGITVRGEWSPGVDYAPKDIVSNTGGSYLAAAAHTSGADFDADLAAGRWLLFSFANDGGTLRADLASPTSGNGASLVQYDADNTVKDRLDSLNSLSADLDVLDERIEIVESGQAAGQKVYRTWSELSATTGSAGVGAQVIDDIGTHTDPVVGGTVSNAGQYVWSASPAGWRWVRPDGYAALNARLGDVEDTLTGWAEQNVTVVDGSYINRTNGAVISSANYRYTKFDVPANSVSVRVSSRLVGAGVALAVYYSDEGGTTYLGSEYNGVSGTTDVVDYVLAIPPGAMVIGITGRIDAPIKVEFSTVVPDIYPRLLDVEGEITDMQDKTDVLLAKSADVEASIGGWVEQDVAVVDGRYISKASGNAATLAGYKSTFFAVPPDRKVRITARVQGASTCGAAYYTGLSGGVGTGFIGFEVDGATTQNLTDFELTIPESANYIGVTSREGYPLIVEMIGIVPDLLGRIETLEDVIDSMTGGNDSISLWGDSMISNSASGIGPEVASVYPNRNVYQQGIGGQDARQVAARMGAWPVNVSISGNSIPTSGTVACTPDIDLLRRSSGTCSCRVMVAGVECRLTFDSSLNGGSGGYYLAPLSYPPSAVTTDASEPMQVLSGMVFGTSVASAVPLATLLSGIVVVRVDRNDSDPTNTVAHVLASNEAIVKQVQRYTNKWVWMGTTNGYADKTTADGGSRPNAAASYAHLSRIAAFNAAASQLYAGHYIDPLANHIANGYGESYSAAGVSYTVLNTSILSDGIHENEAGRAATTALLAGFIASKGW